MANSACGIAEEMWEERDKRFACKEIDVESDTFCGILSSVTVFYNALHLVYSRSALHCTISHHIYNASSLSFGFIHLFVRKVQNSQSKI